MGCELKSSHMIAELVKSRHSEISIQLKEKCTVSGSEASGLVQARQVYEVSASEASVWS